jgi:hypothetical protein
MFNTKEIFCRKFEEPRHSETSTGVLIHLTYRRICFLRHVFEGKREGRIQVTGRQGRKRKQLLDGLKETEGYWKLKDEALV